MVVGALFIYSLKISLGETESVVFRASRFSLSDYPDTRVRNFDVIYHTTSRMGVV